MALIQAAQSGDQKAIQAIQQIKQQADQGDQQAAALMEAMTAIAQQMQQSAQPTQPVTARLGAKLNYIRTIKGECPEGQKLVYFKEGGRVCKKCVEAAGGAKVKDGKKEIADFKKACGGKTKKACRGRKFEDGGKSQKPKYTKDQIAGRTPVKVVNGVKYFLNGDGQVVKDPKGKNSGSWT